MEPVGSPALTVVRLRSSDLRNPPERVITTVARIDLALADDLHAADQPRFYAVEKGTGYLDVVCGQERLAQALLRGDLEARLVRRVTLRDCVATGRDARHLRVRFLTPALWRVRGLDHHLPDARVVFSNLRTRWEALGWPALPQVGTLTDIPVAVPVQGGRWASVAIAGQERCGFIGQVCFDLTPLTPDDRLVLWTLARFGAWRGCGRGTSYGAGRLMVCDPPERTHAARTANAPTEAD